MGKNRDSRRKDIDQLFDDAVRRGVEQRMVEGYDDYLRGRSSWIKKVRRVAAVVLLLLATTAVATTMKLPFGLRWTDDAPVQDSTDTVFHVVIAVDTDTVDNLTILLPPSDTAEAVPRVFVRRVTAQPVFHYDFDAVSPSGHHLSYTFVSRTDGTVGVSAHAMPRYHGRLVVPDTVTYEGCSYRVVRVDDSAFMGCAALRVVALPPSVTAVGRDAFAGCDAIDTVEVLAPLPPTIEDEFPFFGLPDKAMVSVPCGSGPAYDTAYGWDWFTKVIDPCTKKIPFRVYAVYSHIMVEGVYGEEVKVYDNEGELMATKECNGECKIDIYLPPGFFGGGSKYTVKVGDRPAQIVTVFTH